MNTLTTESSISIDSQFEDRSATFTHEGFDFKLYEGYEHGCVYHVHLAGSEQPFASVAVSDVKATFGFETHTQFNVCSLSQDNQLIPEGPEGQHPSDTAGVIRALKMLRNEPLEAEPQEPPLSSGQSFVAQVQWYSYLASATIGRIIQ